MYISGLLSASLPLAQEAWLAHLVCNTCFSISCSLYEDKLLQSEQLVACLTSLRTRIRGKNQCARYKPTITAACHLSKLPQNLATTYWPATYATTAELLHKQQKHHIGQGQA